MNVQYITKVGKELQNQIKDEEFKRIVKSVLEDPTGWPQHKINFIEYIPSQVAALPPHVCKIYLRDGENSNKICGMRGLSCTRFNKDGNPIDIIINYKNWMGGSRSELPLDQYHKYVINHEVGHWLGLEHSKCPLEECKKRGIAPENCPASIMQQMSKGPKHIGPCKESCIPLPPDWGVDNLDYNEIKQITAFKKDNKINENNYNFAIIQLVIYILILIMVIILLVYTIINNKKINSTNTNKIIY